MAGEMIYLNHRDKKCHHAVERIDLLSDLLLKERKSVLLVGEGNFTFTVAFAALRQFEDTRERNQHRPTEPHSGSGHRVWEGIVSTRYEPAGSESEHQFVGNDSVRCKPAPVLSEVKLVCITESISYFHHCRRYQPNNELSLPADQNHLLERIRCITDLPCVPSSYSWQYRIDARHLPADLVRQCEVVWFQCPCSPVKAETGTLVLDFLVSTARHVAGGSHVCVGITKHPDYVGQYGLEGILQGGEVGEWFTPVGADKGLIRKLLEFGYRHEGDSDIHHYILDSHVTLVFRRN